MKRDGSLHSLWQDTVKDSPEMHRGLPRAEFDVVIVGAGVTGITTAVMLQNAGQSVAVVEAANIGFGTSGGTTAHLNTFLDKTYKDIIKDFGKENAVLVAQAIRQAMELIRQNIETYNIDCDYSRLSGYIFATDKKQADELKEILDSCHEVGVDVQWTKALPFNTTYQSAVVFSDQAQMHPLRYLTSLAGSFVANGGTLVENCRVMSVEGTKSLLVKTTGANLRTKKVIYATHIPPGINVLDIECVAYRSYAIACRLENEQDYPNELIYDLEDPYHYIRTQIVDGKKYLIVGGEDHKTGHQKNTADCFNELENFARAHYDIAKITNNWSSQYFEPADGLPYIGTLPGGGENILVATGYGGNGMIHSAIAAILLTDLIGSGASKFSRLFNPSRVKPVAGFASIINETADSAGHLIASLFPASRLKDLNDLPLGTGKVVNFDGHKMAIYKDHNRQVHAISAICTHMKCEISWNDAETSWDCPCHGSRFGIDGEVLTGPARDPLHRIEIAADS